MLVVCAEYLGMSVDRQRERTVPEEITTVSYLRFVKIRAVSEMYTAEGSYGREHLHNIVKIIHYKERSCIQNLA